MANRKEAEKKTQQAEPYGLDVVLKAAREILGFRVFDDDVVSILCAPYIGSSSRRMPWVIKRVGGALSFLTGGRILVSSIVDYRFKDADGRQKRVVLRSAYADVALLGDPDYVRSLVTRMAGGYASGKVALGGTLPSLVKRHGLAGEIPDNCILAQDASAFMVAQAALQLVRDFKARTVAIVGVGDLGREVAKILNGKEKPFELTVYDRNSGAYLGLGADMKTVESLEQLKPADLYVVLSGTGDSGLGTVLRAARPGAVVLSDTYPKISANMLEAAQHAQVTVYDVHYEIDGGRWEKPFAGYEAEAIPGCLAMALAESAGKGETMTEKLDSLGLKVKVILRNG